MSEPHSHLFEVEAVLDAPGPSPVLALPVWTPGSYLVREFARHLESIEADDGAGTRLPVVRLDKHRFRVDAGGSAQVRVRYRVYANDPTVRTSHLDGAHGYWNGANLFLYAEGRVEEPVEVTVAPPPGWRVSTAMEGGPVRFTARDYHELCDSPVEVGTHALATFEALGKRHEVAIAGRGHLDVARFADRSEAHRRAPGRPHGRAPLRALPLHRAPLRPAPRRPGARAEHHPRRRAHRLLPAGGLRGDPGARRPRVPAPLEREAAPARGPPPLRLRPRAVHPAPLVVRGGHELLRPAHARAHRPLGRARIPEAPGRAVDGARTAARRGQDEPGGGEPHRLGEVLPARREQPEQLGLVLPEGGAGRPRASTWPCGAPAGRSTTCSAPFTHGTRRPASPRTASSAPSRRSWGRTPRGSSSTGSCGERRRSRPGSRTWGCGWSGGPPSRSTTRGGRRRAATGRTSAPAGWGPRVPAGPKLTVRTVREGGPAWKAGLYAEDEILAESGFRVDRAALWDRMRQVGPGGSAEAHRVPARRARRGRRWRWASHPRRWPGSSRWRTLLRRSRRPSAPGPVRRSRDRKAIRTLHVRHPDPRRAARRRPGRHAARGRGRHAAARRRREDPQRRQPPPLPPGLRLRLGHRLRRARGGGAPPRRPGRGQLRAW